MNETCYDLQAFGTECILQCMYSSCGALGLLTLRFEAGRSYLSAKVSFSKAVQPEAAEETRERGSRRSSSLCTRAVERVHIAGGQAQTPHTIKACYLAPSKKPRPRSLLTRLHISTTTSRSPFTLSQIWPPAEPPTSLPMSSLVRH